MSVSPPATTVAISNTILKKPPFSVRRLTSERLSLLCGPTRACRWTVHLCDGAHPQLFRSRDRKSTRLNSSHQIISYAVFCLKKKKKKQIPGIRISKHFVKYNI